MRERVSGKGRWLQWVSLAVILLFGLFLRLETANKTMVDHPVRNDAAEYIAYAWNLAHYGVYSNDLAALRSDSAPAPGPDAVRPPAYPWVLRASLWLGGDKFSGAFIMRVVQAQAWVAGLTLLVSTLLAMELLGAWPGLLVGALVAVSPHQSVYVPYLLTETLFGAAVMLALAMGVLALRAKAKGRWLLAAAAGALFGLACLLRPTLDQWVPCVVLLLFAWPSTRRFKRELAALALGFVLAMSPWWVRNEITLHRMSDDNKAMVTVQQGSYPDFMYEGRPETFGYPYKYDPGAKAAEASWGATLQDVAGKFRQQPLAMARWYLLDKLVYFFRWAPPDGWMDLFTYPVFHSPWMESGLFILFAALFHALYGPLMTCGVLGTAAAFLPSVRTLFGEVQASGIRWLALLHAFVMLVHVVGSPFARYSVPFRPITLVLAVFFLLWLLRRWRAWRVAHAALIAP